ncbi:MAG: HDIG domain-containing protein [Candidatus Aquicultor sp.]|nr:HDIG domain-containing protein [Candidatus Aquicultor sp.]
MTPNFGLDKIKDMPAIVDWKGKSLRRSLLALLLFTVILAILVVDFIPDRLTGLQVGKPSPKTVKATRDIEFVDFDRTEALRNEASSHVEPVYNRDWSVEPQVIDSVHKFFGLVRQVRSNEVLTAEAKQDLLVKEVDSSFDKSVFKTVLQMPDTELNSTEALVVSNINRVYSDKITAENIGEKRIEFAEMAQSLTKNPGKNALIAEVGSFYFKPNYFYDAQGTDKLKKEAATGISSVLVNKQKGETIVREGEIVSSLQVKILRELGLLKRGIDLARIGGLALFALVSFIAFGLYLFNYQPKIHRSNRLIGVLSLIFIATILIAKFVGPYYSYFLIPIGAAAMLTALLFNIETAIIMVLSLSLYSGLIGGQNYQYTLYGVLTGLFAIYAIYNIRHRTDLAIAGAWVTLATTILAITTTLLSGAGLVEIMKNLGWGLLGGISMAVLTIGTLPFLEKVFGITTDIKLVELSYANQPLLRELMMKAPGTYNHSIMAGNLAENAAEEIGANPLLARVGAYYHDIGKIKRPLFFVENQIGCENPHDHTNPSLSCLIITSHVKEGIDLGKKYHLPPEILDIINEHHGTSIVAFFYHKAKESVVKETINEENYRYSGQRPKSKEAALVMLSDSVEAAARTIAKPTPGRIEQLIKRIVQSKLDDGQLNESNLTLNDIEKIIRSFTQLLTSLYHTRVEYPTVPVPQARSFAAHGDSNK